MNWTTGAESSLAVIPSWRSHNVISGKQQQEWICHSADELTLGRGGKSWVRTLSFSLQLRLNLHPACGVYWDVNHVVRRTISYITTLFFKSVTKGFHMSPAAWPVLTRLSLQCFSNQIYTGYVLCTCIPIEMFKGFGNIWAVDGVLKKCFCKAVLST